MLGAPGGPIVVVDAHKEMEAMKRCFSAERRWWLGCILAGAVAASWPAGALGADRNVLCEEFTNPS